MVTQITFESLLEAKEEKGKIDCLKALLTEVASRRLNVDDGIDPLLAALKQETSPPVQYMIWMLLIRGSANDEVRELSRETLKDPTASGRGKASAYIVQFVPGDYSWLVSNFRNDRDPEVVFNVGRALLSRDADSAVRAWISCLDQTDSLPLWEVVSEYVVAHGDMNHCEEIRKRDLAMGGASTWHNVAAGIFAAHQVEYLDRPRGPVDHTQPAVWISCDGCSRSLGVRQGREDERIRCLYCGHTFPLHLDPSMNR